VTALVVDARGGSARSKYLAHRWNLFHKGWLKQINKYARAGPEEKIVDEKHYSVGVIKRQDGLR
jgi:hypothetical protein